MINAYVVRDNFPADHFGLQEFAALPCRGDRIAVMDRHSNMHYLQVRQIEFRGVSLENGTADLQRSMLGDRAIILICESDREWHQAIRDAGPMEEAK